MYSGIKEERTGRTRHRISGIFRKKLILQIEVSVQYEDWRDFSWSPPTLVWRDAKPEDMMIGSGAL